MTGISRMYKKSRTVERPAAKDVANNGLALVFSYTATVPDSRSTHRAAPLAQTSCIFSSVPSTYVAAPPGTTKRNCLTRCAESILSAVVEVVEH